MAHFEPNSEEPVEYMLIDVNIVHHKKVTNKSEMNIKKKRRVSFR